MHFTDAKKQFIENAQLFGNPAKEPEKYTLYNGLANLAIGLEKLQMEIDVIRGQLGYLERIDK